MNEANTELLDILQGIFPSLQANAEMQSATSDFNEYLPRIEVALIKHRPEAIKGFAKTKEGRRQQFIADFTDDSQRHCHVCDKIVPLDSLLAKGSEAKVQSVTGRVFCGNACWESYKEAEGL